MQPVLVIGSSNTDMVLRVPELPAPGQTVLGRDFRMFAGGKGANQAVAACRAGASVRFIALLGDDDFARQAIELYEAEGIDTSLIQRVDGCASGVALIYVADSGENCIAVAPGANAELSAARLQQFESDIADAGLLLLQLESPRDTVVEAIRLAAEHGTPCVLNPAPAAALPGALLAELYCITPNQSEARLMTGIDVTDRHSAATAARRLLETGVENVIVTLGAQGALLLGQDRAHYEPAPAVDVVDTTAAGDTFNGVLVAALAEDQPIEEAMRLAVAAASLAVQSSGAIPSIPRRAAFDSAQ